MSGTNVHYEAGFSAKEAGEHHLYRGVRPRAFQVENRSNEGVVIRTDGVNFDLAPGAKVVVDGHFIIVSHSGSAVIVAHADLTENS